MPKKPPTPTTPTTTPLITSLGMLAPVNAAPILPGGIQPITPMQSNALSIPGTRPMGTIAPPITVKPRLGKIKPTKKLSQSQIAGEKNAEKIKQRVNAGFGWDDVLPTLAKRGEIELKAMDEVTRNAIPGMATFFGGLAADIKGLTYNKLLKGEEYSPKTMLQLAEDVQWLGGAVYDASGDNPYRGWFALEREFYDAAATGKPLTPPALRFGGTVSMVGAPLAKVASMGARGAALAAEAGAAEAASAGLISDAARFSRPAGSVVSEGAMAAKPGLSRAAQGLATTSKGLSTVTRVGANTMMMPLKPYTYLAGGLGSLVRNGTYLGNGVLAWGKKAAMVYREQAKTLVDSGLDIRDPQVSDLIRKAERHERWSNGWRLRREAATYARQANDEAAKVSRAITDETTKPEFAEKFGELTPEENQAVISVIDGHTQLLDHLSRTYNIPLALLTVLGRYNAFPKYWLSPEATALAADFLNGGKNMTPEQYSRMSRVVESVVTALTTQEQMKLEGRGRLRPLAPHHLIPVPIVEYLVRALRAAGRDDLVKFMEDAQDIWELPVEHPDRMDLLRLIIENAPPEVALDSSIYPAPMRPIVEMYRRLRRNLERGAIEAGTGEFPTSPRSGEPGAAARFAEKAKDIANKARERMDKLSEEIARLEERRANSIDKLRRLDIIERYVKGETAEALAKEYGIDIKGMNRILANSGLVRAKREMVALYENYKQVLARAEQMGVADGVTMEQLQAEIDIIEQKAQKIKGDYDIEMKRLQDERQTLDDEVQIIDTEEDALTEEMFDAEDDYVANGGDIRELESPDTSLEDMGIAAGSNLDELNTKRESHLKRIEELNAEKNSLSTPSTAAAEPSGETITKEEYLSALRELVKTGAISSSKIKDIEKSFDTTYKPNTEKKRSTAADRIAFSWSKEFKGIIVSDVNGELFWTNGYIMGRVADSPLLSQFITEPGSYNAIATNFEDAKISGFKANGNPTPDLTKIIPDIKSAREVEIVAVNHNVSLAAGATGDIVVLRMEDGSLIGVDAKFFGALYRPGITILATEVNKPVVFLDGKKLVGVQMPIRDAGRLYTELETLKRVDEKFKTNIIKGEKTTAPKPVDNSARLKQIDKELKSENEQLLDAYAEIADAEKRLQQPAKPAKQQPSKKLAPVAPEVTDFEDQFLDDHRGWEQYYSSEDLASGDIEMFKEYVDMKRILLDIWQTMRSIELAMEQPDQYQMPENLPEVYSTMQLSDIKKLMAEAETHISDLEAKIQAELEPYKQERLQQPSKKLAPVYAAQPKEITEPSALLRRLDEIVKSTPYVDELVAENAELNTREIEKGLGDIDRFIDEYVKLNTTEKTETFAKDNKNKKLQIGAAPGNQRAVVLQRAAEVGRAIYASTPFVGNIGENLISFLRSITPEWSSKDPNLPPSDELRNLQEELLETLEEYSKIRLEIRTARDIKGASGTSKKISSMKIESDKLRRKAVDLVRKVDSLSRREYYYRAILDHLDGKWEEVSARIKPEDMPAPETAPRLAAPEAATNPRIAELEAKAAEIQKAIDDNKEAPNYYSNEGWGRATDLKYELSLVKAEIETYSQPVSESEIVKFRQEYGGVPGKGWKRGETEWYSRSEMIRQGEGPGYYTPENVVDGDTEPHRLRSWEMPNFAEKNPNDAIFARISKAPKGYVNGAMPNIYISVPSTWQEFKERVEKSIAAIEQATPKTVELVNQSWFRHGRVGGTKDEKAVVPGLKKLLKYIDKKIADGETTIYEPNAAAPAPTTAPRLAEPAKRQATTTFSDNLSPAEIVKKHMDLSSKSGSGINVSYIEPYSVGQNKNLLGGVHFSLEEGGDRYDPSNSFGYDLMEGATPLSIVNALDDAIKGLEKVISKVENGEPAPFQMSGMWSEMPEDRFWSHYNYDLSTPEMLAQAKTVLEAARTERNLVKSAIDADSASSTRPEDIVPDMSIEDPRVRDYVYESDLLKSLFAEQEQAYREAQTAKEKMKALADLIDAMQKNKEAYQKFTELLNKHRQSRVNLLKIPEQIAKKQSQQQVQQERAEKYSAIAEGIMGSDQMRLLNEMPYNIPLEVAMDPNVVYPGSIERQFMVPDESGGRLVNPIGPSYVPSQRPSTSAGGLPSYEARSGLSGWSKDRSENRRYGDREHIFDLNIVANRLAETAGVMTENEAMRLIVAQHGVNVVDILTPEVVERLIDESTREAKNMPTEAQQSLISDIPDDFIPGIGAEAPGVRSPARNLEFAIRKILGAKIIDQMKLRGYTPIDPFGKLGKRFMDYEVTQDTNFVPQYVPSAIARVTSILNPRDMNIILRSASAINRAFKTSTLAFSLMWQIGDLTTAVILAKMTGVDVGTMIARMKQVYEAEYGSARSMFDPNATPTVNEYGRLALQSGVQDVSSSTAEWALRRGLPRAKERPRLSQRLRDRSRMLKPAAKFAQGVEFLADRQFKINETINRITRHAFFLENLDRILKEKGTDLDTVVADGSWKTDMEIRKAVQDAAISANKWLGDFTDLTIAERQYISLAFPFYAWIKHIHKVFWALGKEHPESLAWYMYMGTLGSDTENDPLDLRLGTIPIFGGAASVNFLNPLADVFEGPVGGLLQGNIRPLGRATGPVPRLLGAVLLGTDIASGRSLTSPAGTGMYTETGMPMQGLFSPLDTSTWDRGAGYALQQFPIATRLMSLLPTGEIPGTNIATGPVLRYSTGEARLKPGTNRPVQQYGGQLASLGRLFSIPFIPSRTDEQIADVYKSARIRLKSLEKLKAKAEAND